MNPQVLGRESLIRQQRATVRSLCCATKASHTDRVTRIRHCRPPAAVLGLGRHAEMCLCITPRTHTHSEVLREVRRLHMKDLCPIDATCSKRDGDDDVRPGTLA
ncbi:hypothetical protein GW17_00035768 [Ensete ventricosum]|nr:hypothetical protein GW17_00035768 [Ensete ventricosum]RZS00491.1 hypothetical protein BHM03_00030197 [Ensete ventricosum]